MLPFHSITQSPSILIIDLPVPGSAIHLLTRKFDAFSPQPKQPHILKQE